ncbi:MAG: hypothetical protein AB8B96_02705 [Lysobacterales bacterium]
MSSIIAVCHTPSDNTVALARALNRGMQSAASALVSARVISPLDAGTDHVLNASAVIVGTTENFGTMAGLSKDFLERIYYPCLEKTQGLPVAVYIRAGQDGAGSAAQIEKIIAGLRWRLVQPILVLQGPYRTNFEQQVQTLGETVVAGIEAGVF